MRWNWQQKDWTNFRYNAVSLRPLEDQFLLAAGRWAGVVIHLDADDRRSLQVDLMSQEALQTSRIEGEILDRESIQASMRRLLGLEIAGGRVRPAEFSIAEVTVSVHKTFDQPLDHRQLHEWHTMLTNGRRDLQDIGRYRTHSEPMQIVSGPVNRPHVHFQAPPSEKVEQEMDHFVSWFQNSSPSGKNPLPALTRAGIAHLWFESIHPYEDGNGRIGRALVEKSLSQALGQPSLILLADTIERKRKEYYDQLGLASQTNQLDDWLHWFAKTILEAQKTSYHHLDFLIQKGRFFQYHQNQLNPRQEKALRRMFQEGPKGFDGGLSAKNYIRITGASAATATRDLNDLVKKGALKKTGERKGTRYWLGIVSL